jgi:hypothetical protein
VKLAELHGKNWLCFRQFALEPDALNLVVGVEGVGKTSLLRACDWLFTGSADTLTTAKGDFNEVVGNEGSLDFSVGARAVINKGGHAAVYDIERKQCGPSLSGQSFDLKIDGVPQAGSRAALEKLFYEKTMPRPVWWLSTNAWRFGNRDAASVATLMTATTGGNVTAEDIWKHASESATNEKLRGLMKGWFDRIPNPTAWDAALRWLESQATTQRKMQKEYKAMIGQPVDPVDMTVLAANRMKLQTIKQQRDEILSNPAPTAEAIERLRADCGPNLLKDKAADIATAKAELMEANPDGLNAKAEEVRMRRLYDQLKSGAKCPTCTQEIPEPLTKHIVKEIGRFTTLAAKQDALDTLESHQRQFEQTEANRKVALDALKTAEKKVAELAGRPAIPALDAEISRLEALVFDAEAKVRAAESAAKAAEMMAGIDLALEAVVKLAAVYKPEGLRSELAKQAGNFPANVTDAYRLILDAPKAVLDFGAATATLDGDPAHKRSFVMLSDAQRAALGFAVSLAIGAQFGIWFAATDYFSELPPAFKTRVVALFNKFFSDGRGTAFFMSAIPSNRTGTERSDEQLARSAAEPGASLWYVDRAHNVTRMDG